MKAACVVAPRKIEVLDVPMPTMNDDEMLVKIDACGVCTSDMATFVDSFAPEVKARRPFPRRIGHEPVGTIVEVGKNVKGYKVGERITGIFGGGSFAEYVSFDPVNPPAVGRPPMIGKVPDSIPSEWAIDDVHSEPCPNSQSRAWRFRFPGGRGFHGPGSHRWRGRTEDPRIHRSRPRGLEVRCRQAAWCYYHPEPEESRRRGRSH